MSTKIAKTLRQKYHVALFLLATISIFEQISIQYNIKQKYNDGEIINIAGRQRMLSQKISKASFRLLLLSSKQGFNQELFQKSLNELTEASSLFEQSHEYLLKHVDELQAIDSNISTGFSGLEKHYLPIINSAKDLIKSKNPKSESIELLVQTLELHESHFLSKMNNLVNLFEQDSKRKTERLATLEFILFLFTLFSLLLIGVFIFQPAVRELMRQESELIHAKDVAESALKVKATFLENMSHESRTPINGILGMTDLVLGSTNDPSLIERIRIIQNCSKELLNLVNNIMDFSNIDSGKIEIEMSPIDIHLITNETVQSFDALASEKHIALSYLPDRDMPSMVLGDGVRLKQILMNLVSNAIKFTEVGKVEILTKAKRVGQTRWVIGFEIKDTGIGVSEVDKGKLFQNFSQVDDSATRRFGGAGLGLAISRRLCEKMGGEISVESAPGKGSTFSFNFQVEECSNFREGKHAPIATIDFTKQHEPTLRILVVDDNPTNQLVVVGFLKKLGYQPDTAKNGREAVECFEHSFYDLVLMDCHMPEMDGYEATKRLLEKYKEPKPYIIALTTSTSKENMDRCYASGMSGFLGKPITLPSLVKVLTEYKSISNRKVA